MENVHKSRGGFRRRALITGITGQDGSYLTELLLEKGYEVHGIKRRSSLLRTDRIDHIYQDPHTADGRLILHYGDLTEGTSLSRIVQEIEPDEVYNLGAQSHVGVSFEQPEYTAEVNALGTLRLLESIRLLGMADHVRYYQASTSELFGEAGATQTEATPFHPRSPYAVAKLYAHWITVNYREAYGLYACNGIMFNHESPRRGETFVTRKITRGLSRVAMGLDKCIYLGNLNARRDWGHAKDYVQLQWRMLQEEMPRDYVIATGQQHSVRQFVEWACVELGIELVFSGDGTSEIGTVVHADPHRTPGVDVGDIIVRVDPRYFRPTEVDGLNGDSSTARTLLGWRPTIGIRELVAEMITADLHKAKQASMLKEYGYLDPIVSEDWP